MQLIRLIKLSLVFYLRYAEALNLLVNESNSWATVNIDSYSVS